MKKQYQVMCFKILTQNISKKKKKDNALDEPLCRHTKHIGVVARISAPSIQDVRISTRRPCILDEVWRGFS
jgi:hypothetical protein